MFFSFPNLRDISHAWAESALVRALAIEQGQQQAVLCSPPPSHAHSAFTAPARPLVTSGSMAAARSAGELRLHNFDFKRQLGGGAFSTVRHAVCKNSAASFAIKTITKTQASSALVASEIKALERVNGHSNVVRFQGTCEDNDNVYILTSLCENGTLFDYLVKHGPVSEILARRWTRQLADALRHCHERGVVNRDIKVENLLLDERLNLVLADFGLAAVLANPDTHMLSTATGSPVWAAPEVYRAFVKPYHGPAADMWSLGAVLHCLVAGALPFDIDNFRNEWHNYQPPAGISPECSDLLRTLLSVDPNARPTANDVLEHSWLHMDSSTPVAQAHKSA